MANTANPIATTTVSTIMTGQAFVTLFRWVSENAAQNDHLVVEDTAGNVVFESYAAGADWIDGQSISKEQMAFYGLKVTTISSGTLYTHLR